MLTMRLMVKRGGQNEGLTNSAMVSGQRNHGPLLVIADLRAAQVRSPVGQM